MPRSFPILALLLALLFSSAFAQESQVLDLSSVQLDHLSGIYSESVQSESRFINGSEYRDSYGRANGHQFFLSENWHTGSLVMDGKRYRQLSLRYDIYADQLIYNHIHESGIYAIKLNSFKIDSFLISGHRFCKINSGASPGEGIHPGFYELISAGHASFYQKWQKRYNDPTQNSPGEFVLDKELYILNQDIYHKISRKPGLIKALDDREKEIRDFIKEKHLYIGSGDVSTIKQVVDYYNSLER